MQVSKECQRRRKEVEEEGREWGQGDQIRARSHRSITLAWPGGNASKQRVSEEKKGGGREGRGVRGDQIQVSGHALTTPWIRSGAELREGWVGGYVPRILGWSEGREQEGEEGMRKRGGKERREGETEGWDGGKERREEEKEGQDGGKEGREGVRGWGDEGGKIKMWLGKLDQLNQSVSPHGSVYHLPLPGGGYVMVEYWLLHNGQHGAMN